MKINDTVYHKYFEGSGTVVVITDDKATVMWSKVNTIWEHPLHTLKPNSMPQIWKIKGHL